MKNAPAALLLGLVLLANSQAAIDTYEFSSDAQRARYRELTEVLRCPKCQNQNIADSNSPIANDLRAEIHRMLAEGQPDDQIIHFMVARYGDFVLYKPPLDTRTALLWYGPGALLLAGAAALATLITRRRRTQTVPSGLSDAEQQRLAKLLQAHPADKHTP